MDFKAVVLRAQELHTGRKGLQQDSESGEEEESKSLDPPGICEEIYGRICNTADSNPPEKLSTFPLQRKTVFIFGPDSIGSIILRHNAYDSLLRLGFDREYIYHEVVEKKKFHWLVLFTSSAVNKQDDNDVRKGNDFFVVPASWDGVVRAVSTCYPDAYEDLIRHLDEFKTQTFETFEKMAGFEFLEAKKNEDGKNPNAPPFYSYSYYCTLPKPRSSWQVRLFLYCEMKLLKLFNGDGHTYTEGGKHGSLEYLCANVPLLNFDPAKLAIIPMAVKIPLPH